MNTLALSKFIIFTAIIFYINKIILKQNKMLHAKYYNYNIGSEKIFIKN